MPFQVFTSYAQADREKYLEKFVAEFREELGGLLGQVDRTTIVFFDRDGVKAGDAWNDTIIEAVRNAKVLVCLMSPTYLGREWCGRELEMFLRRSGNLDLPPGVSVRFIFPIWWQMPVTPRSLPSKLGKYHYRDAQFPPRYEVLGVKGLARKALWKQFRDVVDRLAKLAAETLAGLHQLPPGDPIAEISEIANAFDEQQDFDVRMMALTTGGAAWRPSATDVPIAEAAAHTARRLQIFIRPVEMAGGVEAGVLTAQSENQVVLVVIDASSEPDAACQSINALNLSNLAVLLIDAETPAIGTENWLDQLPAGAFSQARAASLTRVAGAGSLAVEMELLVDEARRRLRAGTEAVRAEDPELANRAREQGVDIETQPHLSGPGADTQP